MEHHGLYRGGRWYRAGNNWLIMLYIGILDDMYSLWAGMNRIRTLRESNISLKKSMLLQVYFINRSRFSKFPFVSQHNFDNILILKT